MTKGWGFRWDAGEVTAELNQIGPRVKRGMVAAAEYTAIHAEAAMKANAPWTDRTGAARNGLGAKVDVSADKVAVILFHSVSYGPYLELRWGGRYAIIEPTLATAAPMFADAIKRLAFD